MTFNLHFNLDNDSFTYNRTEAIVDILEQVKRKVMAGLPEYSIFDRDGNRIGTFTTILD